MTPRELAQAAADCILAELDALSEPGGLGGGRRALVVDSPPGAGKSTLVVRAALALAAAGEPVMVVAQTNEQVDDLAVRLAQAAEDLPGGLPGGLPVGRLSGHDYAVTARVAAQPGVTVATAAADLAGFQVIAGTAAKWATVSDCVWPWAIVDEAYQMRSDMLLRVARRFERALFVGDPGQLDPFSVVDTDRWTGLAWDPMQSAVAVLLANNPDIGVRRLPVSWRLPPSAAGVVAEAFYPFEGFLAGTAPGERRLEFATEAFRPGPADRALQTAADCGWALYELPARQTVRTDAEAVAACAALVARLLARGAVAYSERPPGDAPAGVPAGTPRSPWAAAVTPDRIAVGTAHRDQARAVRAALDSLAATGLPGAGGAGGVTADTANRLQGREFDVVIVLHPLSGRRDATAFHLEAGRLCVLTSRHRHACIVVARAGIPELLDAHPSVEPVHLNVPARFADGWEANQAVMAHLAKFRVRAE